VPTVLIVDDDAALRRAVATTLTDLGHRVAEAGDGPAALAWLAQDKADAVLLDLRMPGMDGLEVLRRIRAQADAPPVAVLTTVSSSVRVHRVRPLGGSEQAKAISLASAAPSKMRGLAEAGERLRFSAASSPSSTSCWRVRATVSTLVSRAAAIWLSLHASPASDASAFSRMRAFKTCRAGRFPDWISVSSCSRSWSPSFTTYFFTFFTAVRFAVTMHFRRCGGIDSEIFRKINDGGH